MSPPTSATATRELSTAEQRREELLAAAIKVFGERGFHQASTTELAKAAGISQAYVFRLFPTKLELSVAVAQRCRERMLALFEAAADEADRAGTEPLEAMGSAYAELVYSDRELLQVQLQTQVAAATEPALRKEMQRTFRELYALVAKRSGASPEELKQWFAHGMLCNVMAAIGADSLDDEWARALTEKRED